VEEIVLEMTAALVLLLAVVSMHAVVIRLQ
jgi:hypothetical protein